MRAKDFGDVGELLKIVADKFSEEGGSIDVEGTLTTEVFTIGSKKVQAEVTVKVYPVTSCAVIPLRRQS